MKKFINCPALIGVIALFSFIGYLATPDNPGDPLQFRLEWSISFGLIGLSLALYLFWMRILPPKPHAAFRIFAYLGLQVISFGLVIAIFRGLSTMDFGEKIGGLFHGDSWFAIYGVIGGAAFALIGIFICYLIWYFMTQIEEKPPAKPKSL